MKICVGLILGKLPKIRMDCLGVKDGQHRPKKLIFDNLIFGSCGRRLVKSNTLAHWIGSCSTVASYLREHTTTSVFNSEMMKLES